MAGPGLFSRRVVSVGRLPTWKVKLGARFSDTAFGE